MDLFASLDYDPLLDPSNPPLASPPPPTPATTNNSSSRKRSRDSDTPTGGAPLLRDGSLGEALAEKLLDPVQRNGALNELLRKSSVSYALDGDAVLQALSSIVYECLDWDKEAFAKKKQPTPTFTPWQHPTEESKAWAVRCQECFSNQCSSMSPEKLRCVESVLIILRNLSFAACNARLLAFSSDILAILVGGLYEGTFASSPSSVEDSHSSSGGSALAFSALHAMVNLAPHLDVTGQKLFCDKLFFSQKKNTDEGPLVPNPASFGVAANGVWGFGSLWLAKRLDAKEDVMTDIPKAVLLELTNAADYVVQVWALFPALQFIFSDPKAPRAVVLMAVDLVQEFVNHARVGLVGTVKLEPDKGIPSARAILVNMPDVVLNRLADLLYIPRLGPDGLSYEDPTTNIVTRVNMYTLLRGYDANVDTDLRDRALDVLVPLLELDSPRMAERLVLYPTGRVRTRLFDALVPILAGQVGRNESAMLASQLLKELAKAGKQSKVGLAYIQGRLVELASRDARISQLMMEHLYPIPVQDTDGDTSDEQEESV